MLYRLRTRLIGAFIGFLCITQCMLSFELRRVRIGVDYGPRFIGVAYSDIFGEVHPLFVIHNKNNLTMISDQIFRLAKYRSASEIVVGIPLTGRNAGDLQRTINNFNGQLCLNFSKVLQSVITHRSNGRLKVKLFDERFTTSEAKLKIAYSNSKASVDSMSAACLLERYLEDKGRGSLLAPACSYPPPPDLENFDYNLVKCHIRKLYFKQGIYDKEVLKHMPKFDNSLLDSNLVDYSEGEELSDKVLKKYEDYYIPRGFFDGTSYGDEEEEEDDEIEDADYDVNEIVAENENAEDDDEGVDDDDDDDEQEEEEKEEIVMASPPPSNRKRPRGMLKNPWWLKPSAPPATP
eukprot:gene10645-11592_t